MDDYEQARKEIDNLATFKKGWDSYDAPPFPEIVITRALKIIDEFEKNQVSVGYITPSSDGDITIEYMDYQTNNLFRFIIDQDGDVGASGIGYFDWDERKEELESFVKKVV